MQGSLGAQEQQIMNFLHERIFGPILDSPRASQNLKQGVRYTIMRLRERDAVGMIHYYWSAIVGTERSISFAALMRREGFERFEEALEEFRVRFNDDFLRRP
jgi:chromosome condensin MukBEF MukE localization factor